MSDSVEFICILLFSFAVSAAVVESTSDTYVSEDYSEESQKKNK